MTAIGLLRAARQAGLSVPGELSVVGFDDIPFAAYVFPALTTIGQPKFEMGCQAMHMLLGLMETQPVPNGVSDIVLQGTLVVRESSGRRAG
jgi:DNA-binding LacI/PurR family transcriptional regulator